MKKIIINTFIMGFSAVGYAQGYVSLDNLSNTSTNPLATSSGLFWISTGGTPVLINQDFNAAFYGGAVSNSLGLVATFLLSDGTATHDNPLPGIFSDPTGRSYPIPGTIESAFMMIQAWTGNFNSYAAAVAGGAPAAQSSVFGNPVSEPPGGPPPLYGMPAMVLSVIPEPSTFGLAGLGGLLLLCRWRPKSNPRSQSLAPRVIQNCKSARTTLRLPWFDHRRFYEESAKCPYWLTHCPCLWAGRLSLR